jgi:hypothetical protein
MGSYTARPRAERDELEQSLPHAKRSCGHVGVRAGDFYTTSHSIGQRADACLSCVRDYWRTRIPLDAIGVATSRPRMIVLTANGRRRPEGWSAAEKRFMESRCGGICELCGITPPEGQRLHGHHIDRDMHGTDHGAMLCPTDHFWHADPNTNGANDRLRAKRVSEREPAKVEAA